MRSLSPILLFLALAACPSGDPGLDPDRVARTVTAAEGDMGVVVDGEIAFSWEVYGALIAGHEDNVFFSPFSLYSALGMTLAGAEGLSEAELSDLLRVGSDEAGWHAALGALTRDLSGDLGRGYTLHVTNRLFGQTDYPWEDAFLAICESDYDAPLEPWDFSSDPEGGRIAVNDWVSEQTADRIEDLLPPGSVTSDTRLVLANAIYFLADWAAAFDPDETQDGSFHRLDGSEVTVPMMTMDLEAIEDHGIESGSVTGAQILRLPYQDDEVSMIVVVPDAVDGLLDLEAGLDAATWAGWLAALSPSTSLIAMPRLEVDWEADLVPVLTGLGAGSLFSSATADLTGMADAPDGDLFVSGVFHKAFVKVDEAGTEAAAATGVVVGVESAPLAVRADRPFLFVLHDDLTGTILFVGRITDPS